MHFKVILLAYNTRYAQKNCFNLILKKISEEIFRTSIACVIKNFNRSIEQNQYISLN